MQDGRKLPRDRGNTSPITAARMAAGLTQAQLAEAVGCRQKDVSRWEKGATTPRTETLVRIARTLSCSLESLLPPME